MKGLKGFILFIEGFQNKTLQPKMYVFHSLSVLAEGLKGFL